MSPPQPSTAAYSPSTHAIHADDHLNNVTDVAPPIHTSTTFRYPSSPNQLIPVAEDESVSISTPLVYSRLASANTNRLETILTPLLYPGTPGEALKELSNHVVSYSSGLSAFHALVVALAPRVVAIGEGYHGCHGVLGLHTKLSGLKTVDLHADDKAWDEAGIGCGSLVHLETPLNPSGEAYNIAHFAERAHKRGAVLSIDATFGPPGLQDPFAWGADVVMHSGTKYIGGHSDMLCGILATKPGAEGRKLAGTLRGERLFLGSVLGGLEGWLGVRSLRTLELRVTRQSASTEKLVKWLHDALTGAPSAEKDDVQLIQATVQSITHASLQTSDMSWLRQQMPNGFGPVFSMRLKSAEMAKTLPSCLGLFHHATSLGGVESLIEWRRMSDTGVDERLLRVSVGVESWEDLRGDLRRGLEGVKGVGGGDKGVVMRG